ncbi:hypothetical protein, partial [Stenotrophomonas maltophilia]|uniref:hypothetical protein n=1 Tax=Stenotrophomonas maltophilia TaxID=40324 RepID=UPI001952C501
ITIRRLLLGLGAAAALGGVAFGQTAPAPAAGRFITVASTTSTVDSGLFNHILPLFRAKTGIEVRVISQGTGQ